MNSNVAPPAPPPYRPSGAVPATPASVPQKPDRKTELEHMATQVSLVAASIPTPGVTDSYLHSKTLSQVAARLRAMAGEL
jgi:hypothetical protein